MTDLNKWLKAFPREDVERRIRELEAELMGLHDAIKMHDRLRGDGVSEPPEPIKLTKPQAVGFILKEAGRPLKSGDIRAQMVERGWLEDSPKATKRFYSTMTRLKSEERIVHRPDGTYELPSAKGGRQNPADLFA